MTETPPQSIPLDNETIEPDRFLAAFKCAQSSVMHSNNQLVETLLELKNRVSSIQNWSDWKSHFSPSYLNPIYKNVLENSSATDADLNDFHEICTSLFPRGKSISHAFPRPQFDSKIQRKPIYPLHNVDNTLKSRSEPPLPDILPISCAHIHTLATSTWLDHTHQRIVNTMIAYSLLESIPIQNQVSFDFSAPLSSNILETQSLDILSTFLNETKTTLDHSRVLITVLKRTIYTHITNPDFLCQLVRFFSDPQNISAFQAKYLRIHHLRLLLDLSLVYSLWLCKSPTMNIGTISHLFAKYYSLIPSSVLHPLLSKWLTASLIPSSLRLSGPYVNIFSQTTNELISHMNLVQYRNPWRNIILVEYHQNKASNTTNTSISQVPIDYLKVASCIEIFLGCIFESPTMHLLEQILLLGYKNLPKLSKYADVMILQEMAGVSLEDEDTEALDAWDPNGAELQVDLGEENFKLYSQFVCPVSQGSRSETFSQSEIQKVELPGEIAMLGEEELAYILPCGHVLAGTTIVKMAKRRNKLKCAYCQWEGRVRETKRLLVS